MVDGIGNIIDKSMNSMEKGLDWVGDTLDKVSQNIFDSGKIHSEISKTQQKLKDNNEVKTQTQNISKNSTIQLQGIRDELLKEVQQQQQQTTPESETTTLENDIQESLENLEPDQLQELFQSMEEEDDETTTLIDLINF